MQELCSDIHKLDEEVNDEEKICMPVPFDKDLLVAIRPTMEFILMSIAIASLILDLAICKWRKLVNLCLYLEMLYSTCTLSFGILTLQNET